MAEIKEDYGTGGANVAPGGSAGTPDLATTLRDIADDLAELRTQNIALLAKLDAEDVIDMDTDYESSLTPAALKTTKG
jgi:hypothetical protein